jgi:hypothetical protein
VGNAQPDTHSIILKGEFEGTRNRPETYAGEGDRKRNYANHRGTGKAVVPRPGSWLNSVVITTKYSRYNGGYYMHHMP